jgi:molecular chaperone DnaK
MITEKAVGIDLGTTNSVVAVLDQSDRRLLFGRHGQNRETLLPSAVAWVPEKKGAVIGRPARARRGLEPEPILSVKRKMGRGLTVTLGGREVPPPHISALILGELAGTIRAAIQEDNEPFHVQRAVITVPAHFKQEAQEATTLAGEEAGLEVVELLHEPTAAAIHYCWQRARNARRESQAVRPQDEETFMIFDLGGGTFDVSVIRKIPNPAAGDDFQTLAIAGDSFLGGDDFDAAIAVDLFDRLARTGASFRSLNPSEVQNRVRWAKLLALAEEIKVSSSDREAVQVDYPGLFADDRGRPVNAQWTYTRQEIEALLRETAEKTIPKCREALKEASLGVDQIDTILMVGGSSRVPLVQRLVRDTFCKPPARCPQPIVHAPDLCVAAGAALKAAALGRICQREAGTARVRVLGYGSAAQRAAAFRVELCDLEDGTGLGGGKAALDAGGGPVYGEVLSPQRALFTGVPLAAEQNNFFRLRLEGRDRVELAGFDLSIRHDPQFVEPLGINTCANVLSYALAMDVTEAHGEQLVREVLAPRLTPLPNEFHYNFAFPGDADALLFPLYADDQQIKRAVVHVPRDTPQGARVELTVSIDGNQKVRCHGEIPDASTPMRFDIEVEAPKPKPVPTRDDFARLKARAEAMARQLTGPDCGIRAVQIMKSLLDIERAFDRRDDAMVLQRTQELESLLAELDPAKQAVDPPVEEFEQLADQCRTLLQVIPRESTIHRGEISKDVEENSKAGLEAAQRMPPDRETYTRCYNTIAAHHQTLINEYNQWRVRNDEEEAAEVIKMAEERYAEARGMSLDDEDRTVLADAKAALDKAHNLLNSAPSQALEQANKAWNKLMQIIKKHRAQKTVPGDASDPLPPGARPLKKVDP